ncbi:13253_t:CDS:2 [Ambispora gerdemannii]|uniref:13253_t:CDS:1 n=1 Tax=Ambispora gerdemannii TaxID=144530 RepID=A0A9N9DVA5_9GLOM|nr:13253_t:CDS:2 [Ambispora gerdemannii]
MATVLDLKMGEPRLKTSWVWAYFDVKTLPDGETVACCKTCGKTFKHGGSTSNLINHLAKTHKVFRPENYNNGNGNGKRSSGEQQPLIPPPYSNNSNTTNYALDPLSINNLTLHPLEFLFGTWRGQGKGKFTGINDFVYGEEIQISPDEAGRGWLYYRQRTWNPARNDMNFHSESGYIRCPGMRNKVELVLAQPTGIASVEEGQIEGTTVSLRSTNIARSSTAKPPHVAGYTRIWSVNPDTNQLTYTFSMSTQEKPMEEHLVATLIKAS